MNGSPEQKIQPFAQNATLPIGTGQECTRLKSLNWGIMAPLKVTIYGLFDLAGTCFYVGQTISPRNRREIHWRKHALHFRPIRTCHPLEAIRIETQVTKAYRRRGQATYNKRTGGPPVFSQLNRVLFCVELNMYFAGVEHAAQFFNCCDSTIENVLNNYNGRHYCIDNEGHYTLLQVNR